MTSKAAFIGRFLGVFALLIVVGWLTGAPKLYARALYGGMAIGGPLANGWSVEERAKTSGRQEIWLRRGGDQLRLALGLDALALGLLPLLSLIAATPRISARRLATCAALGIAGLYALDLLVLLLYPWLVGAELNPVAEITGTFLGLLTFVGGPVILWFLLTFRELGTVWQLGPKPPQTGRRPVPPP